VSREQALAQGFGDFLKKPFTSAELETLINRVMGERQL
jgi:CheY-like chemotaxis protein